MSIAILFYPSALLLIIFALISVFTNKVVNSLLAAVCVFFITAVIFYLLSAEYNALIQLSVYGLAVPILLAIALMFTNTRKEKESAELTPSRYIIFFALGLIFLSLIYLALISLNVFQAPLFAPQQVSINSIRVFDAINKGFLNTYVVAFELISILIFAVVVGISDNAK